jgi:hypothetical protein
MPNVTELVGQGSATKRFGEPGSYERPFLVEYEDELPPSFEQLEADLGIGMGAKYPTDDESVVVGMSMAPMDDSGLVWRVTLSYGPRPIDSPEEDEPGETPGPIIKQPIWGATSSTTSGPVFEHFHVDGNNLQKQIITNSADDPLEGLSRDESEFRLTKTEFFLSHDQWAIDAMIYTNAINRDQWHDEPARTWKCMGCSASLENLRGGVYWVVNWEFAHRRETWNLKPWDMGFHQKVDENGIPSFTGTDRAAIKGLDGKPVRQPAGLNQGVALKPGTPPVALDFRVYRELPFTERFGTIYTPFLANT